MSVERELAAIMILLIEQTIKRAKDLEDVANKLDHPNAPGIVNLFRKELNKELKKLC